MTAEHFFARLQGRWRKAKDKSNELRLQLNSKYGEWYIHAPRSQRDRMDRLQQAEGKASDAIFAWLDNNSPRPWRTGVPANWVCESLTYADAITHDRLSVTPPVAYGRYQSDSIRFAQPIEVSCHG